MKIVYFDATHSKSDREVHTVGAYIASKDNWRKFRNEWKAELCKKEIPYFHATDFEYAQNLALKGLPIPKKHLYHSWSYAEFLPFAQRLQRVIRRKSDGDFRLRGFASNVSVADFVETLPETLKDDVRCRSCYIFNVTSLLEQIALWLESVGYNGPVHYVFAAGDREGPNIDRLFADIRKKTPIRQRFRITRQMSKTGYEIVEMKHEPALQAADIITYELHKNVLNWFSVGEPEHIPVKNSRKSLLAIAGCNPRGEIHIRSTLIPSFENLQRFNSYYDKQNI